MPPTCASTVTVCSGSTTPLAVTVYGAAMRRARMATRTGHGELALRRAACRTPPANEQWKREERGGTRAGAQIGRMDHRSGLGEVFVSGVSASPVDAEDADVVRQLGERRAPLPARLHRLGAGAGQRALRQRAGR